MATVGSLIVRIGADLTAFDNALKRTDRSLRNFTRAADRAGKGLTRNLSAPLAALGAAAFASSVRVGQMADKLLDLEQQTGLSTTALQEWRRVAVVAGVDTDIIADAAMRLQQRLRAVGPEVATTSMAFEYLGVAMKNADGSIRSMDVLLPELVSALAQMDDMTTRNVLATQIFGRGAAAILPVLRTVATDLDAVRQEAHDLGLVLSKDALEAANAFRVKWETLKQVMGASATQIGSDLIPLMSSVVALIQEKFVPAMQNLIRRFSTLSERTQRNIAITAVFVAALGPAILMFNQFAKAIYAVTTAMTFFRLQALKLLPFLGPHGWILVGLAALVGTLAALAIAFRNTRREVDEFRLAVDKMSASQREAEIALVERQLANLRRIREAMQAGGAGPGVGMALGGGFGVEGVDAEIEKLTARLEELRAVGKGAAVSLASDFAEAGNRITGPINTAGLAIGDLLDRMESMQERLYSLRVDMALADTTDEVQKLAAEIETTERALLRAAEAAAKMAENLPDPRIALVDTGGARMRQVTREWDVQNQLVALTGGFDAAVVALSAGVSEVTTTLQRFGQDLGEELGWAAYQAGQFAGRMVRALDSGDRMAAAMAFLGEVLEPMFKAIGPALQAFLLPLAIVGETLGRLFVPVLRILFPVLKAVAIGLTYLGEIVARIAQGIAWAIGQAVRAIGKAIDALPFISGKSIIRAGENLLNAAEQFHEAARQFKRDRDDLRAMSFDDALGKATDSLERFSDAVLNAPKAFNLALLRHQASGMAVGASRTAVPRDEAPTVTYSFGPGAISIDARDRTAEELFADISREAARQAARGGVTGLAIAL